MSIQGATAIAIPAASALIVGYNPSTTVAAGSNGVNLNTFTAASPGTLNVASTTGFYTSGGPTVPTLNNLGQNYLLVADNAGSLHPLAYAAKTATTFTGVVSLDGLSAVIATGGAVTVQYRASSGHLAGWSYEASAAGTIIVRYRDGTVSTAPVIAVSHIAASAGETVSISVPVRFTTGLFAEIAGTGGVPTGAAWIV
jgi:hypothetical protein